ncbi:MAG: phospholipase C [Crocinitomix sp.]|jgi:phospholipase C
MEKMDGIDHIVYIMLENRSMDSVLGWLYENDKPKNFLPIGTKDKPFEGLQTGAYFNNETKEGKFVKRHPATKITVDDGMVIPSVDPHEKHLHVMDQISTVSDVEMGGFYNDFATVKGSTPDQIMACHTPESLPVLNSLAKQYAVSDTYHSSIPTQTNCNRAFAGTGNSMGIHYDTSVLEAWVNNSWGKHESWELDVSFNQRTIWDVLNLGGFSTPKDWMIFYSNLWPTNHNNYCFTQDLFWPTMSKNETSFPYSRVSKYPDNFASLASFREKIKNDNLPTFSFLEPAWFLGEKKEGKNIGYNGNDYHPPGNVGCGEEFLHDLYSELKAQPNVWKKTLFIINFDEHGGTYDHVKPTANVHAPWENIDDGTPKPTKMEDGFDFKSLGVRVPLILASPLIAEKTVIRSVSGAPFDHTSVIATVLNHFGIHKSRWKLGSRTANAPTFSHVITLDSANARMDVAIENPINNKCNPVDPTKVEANDLQIMIIHRLFTRTIEKTKFPKDRFAEIYAKHYKNVKTMDDLNNAADAIFAQMNTELPEPPADALDAVDEAKKEEPITTTNTETAQEPSKTEEKQTEKLTFLQKLAAFFKNLFKSK